MKDPLYDFSIAAQLGTYIAASCVTFPEACHKLKKERITFQPEGRCVQGNGWQDVPCSSETWWCYEAGDTDTVGVRCLS